MRTIFAIVEADLKREFHSAGTLVMFLLLPVLFTWVIASSLGGGATSGADLTNLAIFNQDKGSTGDLLVELLGEYGFDVTEVDFQQGIAVQSPRVGHDQGHGLHPIRQ